jgi:hypothetical protein
MSIQVWEALPSLTYFTNNTPKEPSLKSSGILHLTRDLNGGKHVNEKGNTCGTSTTEAAQ